MNELLLSSHLPDRPVASFPERLLDKSYEEQMRAINFAYMPEGLLAYADLVRQTADTGSQLYTSGEMTYEEREGNIRPEQWHTAPPKTSHFASEFMVNPGWRDKPNQIPGHVISLAQKAAEFDNSPYANGTGPIILRWQYYGHGDGISGHIDSYETGFESDLLIVSLGPGRITQILTRWGDIVEIPAQTGDLLAFPQAGSTSSNDELVVHSVASNVQRGDVAPTLQVKRHFNFLASAFGRDR